MIAQHFRCYFTYWYYGSTHVEPWYFSTRRTSLCAFMQRGFKFAEVWHIICFFPGTLVWYHTDTDTKTTHSGANKLTHPCKYILTSPVMCSQQLFVLHWMNNSLISKICFPQCFCFLKVTSRSHMCWLDSIKVSSSHETQTVLMEMV